MNETLNRNAILHKLCGVAQEIATMSARPKSKYFPGLPRLAKNKEYALHFGLSEDAVGQQKYKGRYVIVNMAGVKFIDVDATYERDNLKQPA